MVKFISTMCFLALCLSNVFAQDKNRFCPEAVSPYGIVPPRINTIPRKYLEMYLPFCERIQIFFAICIAKDGRISNLKYLKAKKYDKDDTHFKTLDSVQICNLLNLDVFEAYINQTTFVPAGNWEGTYKVTCEMILLFEAYPVRKGNRQQRCLNRKFKLLN